MKKIVCFFALILSLQLSPVGIAQTVDPTDVEILFNFAEQTEPGLFAPAGSVTQGTEPGWLYRFYTATQSYAAVHIGSGGEFQQGAVYVLGGPFGDEVTFIDSLDNLITLINNSNPGGQSGITNSGNGNCVVMNLPAVGALANTRSVSFGQGNQIVLDFSIEYVQVSNTQFVTKQISEANIGGSQSTTVNDATTTYQLDGDLRYIISIGTNSTSTIQGAGSTSLSTDISYSPRLFNGPANTFCEEQEWFVAATAQTVTNSNPPGSNTSSTTALTATVVSVSESVTVPAGSFSTVRMELDSVGFRSIVWSDPDTGLNIKAESYDGNNVLTSTTELQSIE